MSVITGGSANPGIVCVYRVIGDEPALPWHFATGDRAHGGLRGILIEDRKLVVELNSPERSQGDCCPTRFVRTTRRWTPEGFEVVSQKTLNIPE